MIMRLVTTVRIMKEQLLHVGRVLGTLFSCERNSSGLVSEGRSTATLRTNCQAGMHDELDELTLPF